MMFLHILLIVDITSGQLTPPPPISDLSLIPFLQKYFHDRKCLTFIELQTQNSRPDEIYNFSPLPQINHFNPRTNRSGRLSFRPRRDQFTEQGILNSFCPESLHGALIISRNAQDLQDYFTSAGVTVFMNPQAVFFIYLMEGCEGAGSVSRELWRIFRAPHVVVFGWQCAGVVFSDPMAVPGGQIDVYRLQDVLEDVRLVRKSLRDNRGYPLRGVIFFSLMADPVYTNYTITDFWGIDGHLFSLICERMNFTKVVTLPLDKEQYGARLPNGTFTGGLHSLLEDLADIAVAGYFLKDYYTRDVEFSATAIKDDLCMVVHKAQQIPQWQTLYYYYDANIWFALVGLHALMGAVWAALQGAARKLRGWKRGEHVWIDTLRVMISASVVRDPPLLSEKIFFVLAMLAFTTFTGTFQGSLVTVFSNPLYYPDVNTLAQLADTGLPIVTRFEGFRNDLFTDESSPTMTKLRQQLKVLKPKKEINKIVADEGTIAGLARRSSIDLDNKTKFEFTNGLNQLHIVKECARVYMLAYVLPKSSPFAEGINELILRAAQSGLFLKWYDDMAANTTLFIKSLRRNANITLSQSDERKKFSLTDMQIAFYELGIGIFGSILAFCGEMIYGRATRKHKLNKEK